MAVARLRDLYLDGLGSAEKVEGGRHFVVVAVAVVVVVVVV